MTDFNTTVIGKTDGTFGTFTVKEGTVRKGSIILLTHFGNNVLIPTNARSTFTVAAEHAMFDGLMFALMSAKVGVEYIDNVRAFLNPANRFTEFLKMDAKEAKAFSTKYNLGLSDEELRVAAITKSAKEKFAAVFALPGVKSGLSQVNLAVFGEDEKVVQNWLDGGVNFNSIHYSIRSRITNLVNRNPEHTVLRLEGKVTGRRTIRALTNYAVTETRFKAAYKLIEANRGNVQDDTNLGRIQIGSYDRYNLSFDKGGTMVKIGCQSVPLSEVDRIAGVLGIIA